MAFTLLAVGEPTTSLTDQCADVKLCSDQFEASMSLPPGNPHTFDFSKFPGLRLDGMGNLNQKC